MDRHCQAFATILQLINAPEPEPTLAPQYAKRYVYDCNQGNKRIEADTWRDHLKIAKEAVKWKAGGKWQPAFDTYMGTDSKTSPWSNAIKRTLLPS